MLIKDICKIINGSTPSTNNQSYWNGDIIWLTPDDLSNHHGRYINHGERTITKKGYDSCSTTLLPIGTILLTSRAPIGYLAIASTELCTNQGFKSLVCDEKIVNNLYLFYWLESRKSFLQQVAGGSTFKELSKEVISSLEIILPSLEEQQHIVDTIGSVDDLIEKCQELSKKISQFKQYLFRFFSNKETELVEISSLVEFEGGAQPPKAQHIYAPKDGYIRFVQNRDYADSSHLTYIPISRRNKICDEFDIMIDKYGEAGKTRWGIAGAYNVALMKITPKEKKYKEYIRDFLSQETIRDILDSSSQASTRASLNPGTFKGIKIPLLKNGEDIQKYQRIASMLQEYLLLIKNKIDILQNLKETLLHKYFD